MKVYKLKFLGAEPKEAKKEFVKYNDGKDFLLDDKKKSVVIKAHDKDEVREMIARTERESSYCDYGYCFGVEDEDFSIKKVADDEEDYERDI